MPRTHADNLEQHLLSSIVLSVLLLAAAVLMACTTSVRPPPRSCRWGAGSVKASPPLPYPAPPAPRRPRSRAPQPPCAWLRQRSPSPGPGLVMAVRMRTANICEMQLWTTHVEVLECGRSLTFCHGRGGGSATGAAAPGSENLRIQARRGPAEQQFWPPSMVHGCERCRGGGGGHRLWCWARSSAGSASRERWPRPPASGTPPPGRVRLHQHPPATKPINQLVMDK